MKKCIDCDVQCIAKKGSYEFDFYKKKVIITGVPMECCPQCGEEYIHGTDLIKIDQIKQLAICYVGEVVTLDFTECQRFLEEICIA